MHLKSLLLLLLSSSLVSASPTTPRSTDLQSSSQDIPSVTIGHGGQLVESVSNVDPVSRGEEKNQTSDDMSGFFLKPYEEINDMSKILISLKERKDPDLIVQVFKVALSIYAEQPKEDTRLAAIALDKEVMDIVGDKIGDLTNLFQKTFNELARYDTEKALELVFLSPQKLEMQSVNLPIVRRALERIVATDNWDRISHLEALTADSSESIPLNRYILKLIEEYLANKNFKKLELLNKIFNENQVKTEIEPWMAHHLVTKLQCAEKNSSLIEMASNRQRHYIAMEASELIKNTSDDVVKQNCQNLLNDLRLKLTFSEPFVPRYAIVNDLYWKELQTFSSKQVEEYTAKYYSHKPSSVDQIALKLYLARGDNVLTWASQFNANFTSFLIQCSKGQVASEGLSEFQKYYLFECLVVAGSKNISFIDPMLNTFNQDPTFNYALDLRYWIQAAIESGNEQYARIALNAANVYTDPKERIKKVFLSDFLPLSKVHGTQYLIGEKYTEFLIEDLNASSLIGEAVAKLWVSDKFEYLNKLLSKRPEDEKIEMDSSFTLSPRYLATQLVRTRFQDLYKMDVNKLKFLLKNKEKLNWGFAELKFLLLDLWDVDLSASVFAGKWIGKTEGYYYDTLNIVSKELGMGLDDLLKELQSRSSNLGTFDSPYYNHVIAWLYVNTEDFNLLQRLEDLSLKFDLFPMIVQKAISLNRFDDLNTVLDKATPYHLYLERLMKTARRYGRLDMLNALKSKLQAE